MNKPIVVYSADVGNPKLFRLINDKTGQLRGYLAYRIDYGHNDVKYGISLCHPEEESFSVEEGKRIALEYLETQTKVAGFFDLNISPFYFDNNEADMDQFAGFFNIRSLTHRMIRKICMKNWVGPLENVDKSQALRWGRMFEIRGYI